MATLRFTVRKLLIVFALLNILMCSVLVIMGMFAPKALGFLEPVLCPPGMHLGRSRNLRPTCGGASRL